MGFLLLNEEFESIDIIESFDSLIWTDRYSKAGDFEIFLGVTPRALELYKKDCYIWSDESQHQMIIEDLEIEKDDESALTLAVTGRSLESILDRRIVWTQTNLTGNLQNAVLQLLNENAIAASDTSRNIPGLVFEASTDPAITSLTIDIQLLGENLYEAITAICEVNEIGFKITMNALNQMVFKLYSGMDRSYDQVMNPRVVFSPTFDNIGASKYFTSKRTLKTVSRVAGEGEGSLQKFVTVPRSGGAGSGLSRREIFTDATANTENGAISDADYIRLMQLDGARALVDSSETAIFDGEIVKTASFEYNKDFGMGDIVQLEDSYVTEALSKSRVVEFIRSISPSGNTSYPTLQSVQ